MTRQAPRSRLVSSLMRFSTCMAAFRAASRALSRDVLHLTAVTGLSGGNNIYVLRFRLVKQRVGQLHAAATGWELHAAAAAAAAADAPAAAHRYMFEMLCH